jgi:hypothetical protein
MTLEPRYKERCIAASVTTVATLGCILAACLVTRPLASWLLLAALVTSLGISLFVMPQFGGRYWGMLLLGVLQCAAFATAGSFSHTLGAWFYIGVAATAYQLIIGLARTCSG